MMVNCGIMSYGNTKQDLEIWSDGLNKRNLCICWVVPPPRMPVAKEGLLIGSPDRDRIILVVTFTGQGDNPMLTFSPSA